MAIEWYEHHGRLVAVRADLRGLHTEHCLCYQCSRFHPNEAGNCPMAQRNYEMDVELGLVTPVWECPEFEG